MSAEQSDWLREIPVALARVGAAAGEAEVNPALPAALELAKKLPETLEADVGAVFHPDTIAALALVRQHDPGAWAIAKIHLRGNSLLRDVEWEIKKLAPSVIREVDGAGTEHTVGEFLPSCRSPNMRIPGGFELDEYGTYVWRPRGNAAAGETPSREVVAHAPVVIGGRLRDIDTGAHSLDIYWLRPDGWRHRIVDRGVALDKNRIVALAGEDLPVSSNNAAALTRYLERVEALNYAELPTAQVSSHLGWQGRDHEHGFLVGRTLITATAEIIATPKSMDMCENALPAGGISFRGLTDGDEQIVDAFRTRGTLEQWLQAVKVLRDYPRVLTGLYASFVPPMLGIIPCPNFIIDWAYRTSAGKTTTLRGAASVWGNPNEDEPDAALRSWDSTQVYIERAASILSGLPLILDETKRVKDPRLVANILYEIATGQGRGRGNTRSTAFTRAFRTVLLSTGEMPAVCFTQDGGTRARCLEIRGAPFGSTSQATLVRALDSAIKANYGHAGPEFVRWLLGHRDHWARMEEEYRAKVQYFSEHAPKDADPAIVDRLAQSVAAISLVANYVHAALDLPWEFQDPLDELWTEVLTEASDAAGDERALRDVISWAHSNEQSFYGRHANYLEQGKLKPRMPASGWAGRWDPGEDWPFIAFHPHVLRKVLVDLGYAPEAILAGWKERDWLIVDGDRPRYTTRQRVMGERPHLVAIKFEAIRAIEGETGGDSGDVVGT
jgi:putative DNA primase/helicase